MRITSRRNEGYKDKMITDSIWALIKTGWPERIIAGDVAIRKETATHFLDGVSHKPYKAYRVVTPFISYRIFVNGITLN